MATIPVQATGLRHVRKTITFDGGANNGKLGDAVPVFTTTGRVAVRAVLLYWSTGPTCSAPTVTGMQLGVASAPFQLSWPYKLTGAATGLWWSNHEDGWSPISGTAIAERATGKNIILTVSDEGGGAADITAGVLVIDVTYYPITDDGALAGDDIDTELGAYLADAVLDEALAGHTTAGSLGKAVADVETDVDAVLVDTSTTLQAELDGIQADTEDIQARLPAALIGGRIDATIDATGMEAGAIDAILTRQMTESYAADGAAPTLAQALFEIMQCLTEFAISGTTITVKKRDGSTTAMTFTLDSATKPTSRTRAT